MSLPRLLALALMAALLAVSACGKKGEPIRPTPAPETAPAPPPPPGPALPEPAPTTTPGGADIF